MSQDYKLDNHRDFLVQGSEAEPYRVTFKRDGSNITALCNCKAGTNGMHCKHRLEILTGKSKSIVSGNEADMEVVVSWLPDSDVEAVMVELAEAEVNLAAAKTVVSGLKKKLARTLLD